MESKEYIIKALTDLSGEVNTIMSNLSLSLTEKDKLMFPLLQKKRVLEQTLQDLSFLDTKYENYAPNSCKVGQYR
jgi:hypothetical protein